MISSLVRGSIVLVFVVFDFISNLSVILAFLSPSKFIIVEFLLYMLATFVAVSQLNKRCLWLLQVNLECEEIYSS